MIKLTTFTRQWERESIAIEAEYQLYHMNLKKTEVLGIRYL